MVVKYNHQLFFNSITLSILKRIKYSGEYMQVNLSPDAFEKLKSFRKEVWESEHLACTYSQLLIKLFKDRE